MKIAIDACSIILLAKATILETFANNYGLFITDRVYKEILEGKDKKFADALLTERLVREGKIKINKVEDKKIMDRLIDDFNLGSGEAETLALALDKKCDVVCTDNKQGRKTAMIYNLELVGSIEVVIALCNRKLIDKEKSISALKELKEFGWFQDYLIDNALESVNRGG